MPDEDTGFKVGDVVCFNSGGRPMTIISLAENSATYVWSVRDDAKSKSYPVEALKHATAPLSLGELVEASMKLREEDHSDDKDA
jgi:uncharacterized protein YodC (DUF2158 family)